MNVLQCTWPNRLAGVLFLSALGLFRPSPAPGADCVEYGTDFALLGTGGTYGNALAVAVSGSHAYLVTDRYGWHDYACGFFVFDVSDPRSPRLVGSTHAVCAERVILSADHAYLVSPESDLQVIDVSDPADPHGVAFFDLPASDIAVHDGYAYLASSGLKVLDVGDPGNPRLVGRWTCPAAATGSPSRKGWRWWPTHRGSRSWTSPIPPHRSSSSAPRFRKP